MISTRQITKHFWKGIKPFKWSFFSSYVLFTIEMIVGIYIPILYKQFFDFLETDTEGNSSSVLISIITTIVILHLLMATVSRIGVLIFNSIESKIVARLKQQAFDYLINHSHSFFINTFAGSLVQKVNRYGRAFENIFDTLMFNLMPVTITIIGSIFITFKIAPFASYVIMAWVGIYLILNLIYVRWHQKYDVAVTESDTETTAHLADSIGNYLSILLFTNKDKEREDFKSRTEEQAKRVAKSWNIQAVVYSAYLILVYIVEFFVFYYAIKLWGQNQLTIGTFILIQMYVIRLAHELYGINRAVRNISESLSDTQEMVDILETPHEIRDIPQAKDIIVKQGTINLKDVTFSFNKTREVLDKINLEIKSGEKVALVGHSGAGKTTLIRLILRLYDLTSGHINIDDQDISKVTQESLHRHISLVPQDPVLFHRSLLENIKYGKPEATLEEVITAAKQAHCHEFIDLLPQKYDTQVGERGVKLSGGERQRVAIARAILKNAPILILDEATSSLDSESELLIQDALDTLMKNRTTIVIAHRLSTIRKMDRIIVLKDGKIIEDGDHETLLKNNATYADLWKLQVSGFIQE